MSHGTIGWGMRLTLVAGVFAGGFVCGSVSQRSAEAQLPELGGAVMKQAGESGGALGAATRLGSSIVEMQEHVDALQKNINTLKEVKSTLGG